MGKLDRTDLLETLFDLIPFERQDALLGGYIDALHENELGVQYHGASVRDRAKDSMLDNAADSSEVCSEHVKFCLRILMGLDG